MAKKIQKDKIMKIVILTMISAAILLITGCTDTTISSLFAYGNKAEIVCYSGTKKIYDGGSTGKVKSAEGSDGYLFRDAATGKLTEVSGNCILRY